MCDIDARGRKSGQSSSRQHAARPEATPLDFVVRPQSKIDPDEIRARAKQAVQDQRRMKVSFPFYLMKSLMNTEQKRFLTSRFGHLVR